MTRTKEIFFWAAVGIAIVAWLAVALWMRQFPEAWR